jgi:hypothetical protein
MTPKKTESCHEFWTITGGYVRPDYSHELANNQVAKRLPKF